MKQRLLILGLLITSFISGQESNSTDFLSEIQKFDISDLWTLEKFQAEFEGDTSSTERQEPLGFIGENYQRFYIHFISVIQNPKNRLEYFVYGKTRVKTNICTFQGLITIQECKTYIESDLPPLKQGFVSGDYEFFEDSDQKGTGVLKGVFKTGFYIDTKGDIHYDALNFVADGFKNNQFEGTWTSYKTKDSKECNWGDYRIPESGNFDIGAGEFSPSQDYASNGWITYILDHKMNKLDVEEDPQVSEIEHDKWWIDK
jgi:hypothetical protein